MVVTAVCGSRYSQALLRTPVQWLRIAAPLVVLHDKLSDLTSQQKLLTLYNAGKNLQKRQKEGLEYRFVTGKGLYPFREICRRTGKFDLIISAPPYLPKVVEYGIAGGLGAAVSGTYLIEELVRNGEDYANEIVVQFSQIAMEEFQETCRDVGIESKLLSTKTVPIRISPIEPIHPEFDSNLDPSDIRQREEYENRLFRYKQLVRYNEFLENERGMQRLNKDNYKYWHDIYVYSIKYP